MKQIAFLIACTAIFSLQVFSQETSKEVKHVLRANFLNPGIELEVPVFKKSSVAFNVGVGYDGSYPQLTTSASGWLYMISPFADVQYRKYYNFQKRIAKQKNVNYNAASFLGARILVRGEAFSSNFTRTTDYDFAVGPIWGIQRSFGKINLLFDLGAVYYFDTKGNDGFLPMLELSVGYNFDIKQKN